MKSYAALERRNISAKLLIGTSLSEPHTSGTTLRKCVCNVLVCLRPYTVNFKCVFKYFLKIERPRALSR